MPSLVPFRIASILIHATTNTGRSIFPGSRTTCELADGIVCYPVIAIAAATVMILREHKTLKQFRSGRNAGTART